VADDGETALISTPRGELVRVTPAGTSTLMSGCRFLEVSPEGKIYWVKSNEPAVLYSTDWRARRARKYVHGATVRDIACADDGLYLVDSRRSLIFVGARRPRRLRGDVSFVDSLGARLLAGSTADGNILKPEPGKLHYYGSGRASQSLPYPGGSRLRYLFDPEIEELLCLDEEMTLRRYDPSRQDWVLVAAMKISGE
jgi:hypothetical protein